MIGYRPDLAVMWMQQEKAVADFAGGMDDAGKEYPVLGKIYVNSK